MDPMAAHLQVGRSSLDLSCAESVTSDQASDASDEIIPNAIVIKNIPFSLDYDQLVSVLRRQQLPRPYALNLHCDKGLFRGLAFANFKTAEDAKAVLQALDGFVVLGRALRVEYKKVLLPEQQVRKEAERKLALQTHGVDERSPLDAKYLDPTSRAYVERMMAFQHDETQVELVFERSISGTHRRLVRTLGQRLGFFYRSDDSGQERFFKVDRPGRRQPPTPVAHLNAPSPAIRKLSLGMSSSSWRIRTSPPMKASVDRSGSEGEAPCGAVPFGPTMARATRVRAMSMGAHHGSWLERRDSTSSNEAKPRRFVSTNNLCPPPGFDVVKSSEP